MSDPATTDTHASGVKPANTRATGLIVATEADGDTFPCYTGDGERSVGQVETEKRVLPGAVELDESRGKEQLHAILCHVPFSFDQVEIQNGRVVSPPGCVSSPFLLDKEDE